MSLKKPQYIAPLMLSISISVLRKSPDFLIVDLVPLRHINADLRSEKEVLASLLCLSAVVVQALFSHSTSCSKNQRGECSMFDIEHPT